MPISRGARATAVPDLCLCDLDERSCPAPMAIGRAVPQCQTDLGLPHPTRHCRRWPPRSRVAGCGRLLVPWPPATSRDQWVQVRIPTQASADPSLLRSNPSGRLGDRQQPYRTWPVQSQPTPNAKAGVWAKRITDRGTLPRLLVHARANPAARSSHVGTAHRVLHRSARTPSAPPQVLWPTGYPIRPGPEPSTPKNFTQPCLHAGRDHTRCTGALCWWPAQHHWRSGNLVRALAGNAGPVSKATETQRDEDMP
jgi:hypothetical protein